MEISPVNSISFGPSIKDAASLYAKNSPVGLVSPQKVEAVGIDQGELYDLKKLLIQAIDSMNFALAVQILDKIIKMHKDAGVIV
jgi:hypothetical protein